MDWVNNCPKNTVNKPGGKFLAHLASFRQYATTLRMLSPEGFVDLQQGHCLCVIMGSISIFPSMYQSTILGTSVRPRAPPNAVPFPPGQ
jgi:hypothetical protein